jgi:hypothetical protein
MRPLVVLWLAATLAFPQTLVQRTYLVRAETATMDSYTRLTHVCVLVYPDGKYRLERSFQDMEGEKPWMEVYLGQLPDPTLWQLQSTLDDPSFQAIKTTSTIAASSRPQIGGTMDWPVRLIPGSHSRIDDTDVLRILVPRVQQLQDIKFENARQRDPYQKTLKPFLSWMKDVERRKVSIAKKEPSDNCRPPQLLYKRYFSSPTAKPEEADRLEK